MQKYSCSSCNLMCTCREDEARIQAEEVKLERLRQRIEDQDWKLMRGQLSVHEYDLANEFKDIDGDSDDSLHATQTLGA